MRGMRGRLGTRSGAGGMKAPETGGSNALGSAAEGSGNSDGFGWIGRMVTSSTEVIGSTAAATAAFAAFSIASWA